VLQQASLLLCSKVFHMVLQTKKVAAAGLWQPPLLKILDFQNLNITF
jgi:hypothetical protein